MYGHHRFSEAAKALIVAATATSLIAAPTTALACTQVYMGPELTATGETIYGRSEDAANRYLKEFGVQPRTDGKTYWSGENGPDQDATINGWCREAVLRGWHQRVRRERGCHPHHRLQRRHR